MSSPLTQAGAVAEPSKYAPLHTDTFFTGLWTQRNPLRDAAVPYVQKKFYSASRFESLIDGLNTELTTRLTLARRYGHSVYNSQTFPAINRFYEFRIFSTSAEIIKMMADSQANVYDATGPNTKLAIYAKLAGAGSSYFQSVGNSLFWGDGVAQKKWVQSAKSWLAGTQFKTGDFFVDTNNNLQVCVGAQSVGVNNVTILANVLTIVFQSNVWTTFFAGMRLGLSGFVANAFLNGQNIIITSVGQNSITAAFVHADVATVADALGIAATANGVTGAAAPAWSVALNGVTLDDSVLNGGQQWICKGSSVQDWGIPTPALQPSVANSSRPSIYPNWAANTIYTPSLAIVDSNNNIQALKTPGTSAAAQPTWSAVYNVDTADGTAVWTCKGPAARANVHAYVLGDYVSVTFTYYITVPGTPNRYNPDPEDRTYAITTTEMFKCTVAGNSAAATPVFKTGLGSTVKDGTVTWTNVGVSKTWLTGVGASTAVSNAQIVIDSNGSLQSVTTPGKSGAVAPAWKTKGASTHDNTVVWINAGLSSAAGTGSWQYAFAGKNSVTQHVGTASPMSNAITVAAASLVTLQGAGIPDTQADLIQIYRTAQGGSVLLLLDEIPNPGAGGTWSYNDPNWDDALNFAILAQINHSNDQAPTGLTRLAYHLGRIWGAVGNTLFYSNGPNTTNGSGNEAFPPSNNFVYPSAITRLWPSPIGLLVFTVSDVYIVLGSGTSSSSFYSIKFLEGVGLLSYDAFCVNGSTAYLMTSAKKVISLDPGAGLTEIGFPIGDQFETLYDATTAKMTWHEGSSKDTALYVSDAATGWFRMAPTSAPESGIIWSPRAVIAAGCKAVQSVETSPGINQLLVGPGVTPGPILKRDATVNRDNGVAFSAFATIGSITLAEPGELAELLFITLDSMKVGKRPTLGLLLGEISGTFSKAYRSRQDPPLLPPSSTIYNDRYYMAQNQQPTYCRHFQLKISWAAEDAHNELLAYTIFGAIHHEMQ
jgi:hypothetical protein